MADARNLRFPRPPTPRGCRGPGSQLIGFEGERSVRPPSARRSVVLDGAGPSATSLVATAVPSVVRQARDVELAGSRIGAGCSPRVALDSR